MFLGYQTPEMVFGPQVANRIRQDLMLFAGEVDRKDANWRVRWVQYLRAEHAQMYQ